MAVDDDGRGVEGVEGGALGRIVFLGREQGFELLAQGLPAGVLVAAGDGIGKERQRHGPKPPKRASMRFSSRVAGRCSCSIRCNVRMAAMMSRALAFSPLAMSATRGRLWFFHDAVSFCLLRPRQPGPFGASRQRGRALAHRRHRAAGARCNRGSRHGNWWWFPAGPTSYNPSLLTDDVLLQTLNVSSSPLHPSRSHTWLRLSPFSGLLKEPQCSSRELMFQCSGLEQEDYI